jgi:NADH:ubiquinone oxidoreductase subunit K
MFAIAVIAGIIIVAVAIIVIYFGWRGYKTKGELFPFILSICAFPILVGLAVLIIHKNL